MKRVDYFEYYLCPLSLHLNQKLISVAFELTDLSLDGKGVFIFY